MRSVVLTIINRLGRVCMEKRHTLFRFAVIVCLYGIFLINLTPLVGNWNGSGITSGHETDQDGIGGGYFEKASDEEQLDADETIETWGSDPDLNLRPRTLLYSSYTVQQGDVIGHLAERFGLRQDSLISVNGIRNTRLVQINHVLRIPNQDGILYTVKDSDTLETIAESHSLDADSIKLTNELFS